MKKVLLISPKSTYFHPSVLGNTPLSGLLVIATILKEKGYFIKFIDETFLIPDYEKIEDFDIVLISSMSATANRAYFIADIFKKKGIKVVLGGIHVSFLPQEALKHCDQVVIGEAEEIIIDIIEERIRSKIVKGVKSDNISKYPMPDYSLIESINKNPDVIGVSTSRGCPFNCIFCSLAPMFGRKIRTIPTDKIVNYLSKFNRIKKLSFHEANFTIDKKRAVELLEKMKDRGISPRYTLSLQTLDVAENNKILKLMSEISDFHLLIGFESIDQKTLNFFNKKQTPKMIKKCVEKIHDYNIKIMGNFVFGADTDDKSVFQKVVDFCNYAEIDHPGFDILTPFVGTKIRADLESQNRIFCNNWDFYDMQHTVFYPKKMTPLDLQEGFMSAFENFYSTKNMIKHALNLRWFHSFDTFYTRKLFKWCTKQNKSYLDYLNNVPA